MIASLSYGSLKRERKRRLSQQLEKLERDPGAYYDDRCSDTLVSATGIADLGAGWIDLLVISPSVVGFLLLYLLVKRGVD